ncbi:MAG: ABC transporter substrate-binding protein [Blastocatellia bacterium]
MRLRSFQPFALFILLATLCVVAACRSSKPPENSSDPSASRERVLGRRGGSLSYRVASPPQTFNYLKAADEASLIVAFYLMGGRLVEFDHDNQRYVPGVAENWKSGDGGRSVEVTLRDGVKFSDGHPLAAEDVRFTLRALYDERTAAPIFRDAMLINGRQIEAVVVDARRLRMNFPEPVATPEVYLSNLAVLPRHALEADFNRGAFGEAYSLTADPRRIVTAGAFAAHSVAPGERVTLKRNLHYWKKDNAGTPLPYLDELVIEVASDANNALARLRQGGLDVFDRIRPNDYAALRSQTGTVRAIDLGPGLNTDHLWFNLNAGEQKGKTAVNPVKRAWFNDVRFRRAVSHAIDRETIASITLQGLATPLHGFVSPGNRAWVAEGLPRIAYDLARARALLDEAGFALRGAGDRTELYDAKGNRVELTLIVPVESQPRIQMATVAQEDLAKLGIKLQIAPIEFGELSRRISQSYDYDAALLGANISEPDPSSYVNFLRSSSPSHQWHPRQTKPATEWEGRIDELLAAQAHETDPVRRRAIFREIQSILAEQLPVIPLVARHTTAAANQRAGNHRPSALLPYSLWNAEELFVR